MEKQKNIFRDYYRFYFKKNKTFDVRNISIWQVPSFSIEEREEGAIRLKKWLDINQNSQSFVKVFNINKDTFEGLTERILNSDNDDELFIKLYTSFNRRKYLPNNLTKDLIPINKIISLKAYCNFSKILLQKYMITKNIQFLNTSLKVNDFLLYCQIKCKNNKLDGSIASYFPLYHKGFRIDVNSNKLFFENLTNEIRITKTL